MLPPSWQSTSHCLGRFLRIEILGIERPCPFQILVVPFMVGIGQGFKEFGIAPDAAHIFGRTRSLTLDAKRILFSLGGTKAALEQHFMLPAVPKVILVLKAAPLAVVGDDLADASTQGIDRQSFFLPAFVEQLGIAMERSLDLELMEVRVCPAHGCLNMFVEFVQGAVLDLNSPTDRRLDFQQRDLELIHTL